MFYRTLGASGLKVSAICLGTMMFGDRTDLDEAKSIVASALDAGVNFIDTADIYKTGASETMVGQAIRDTRSQWVVATKVGNAMSRAPNESGYSSTWIHRAIDASLGDSAMEFPPIRVGQVGPRACKAEQDGDRV